MENSDFAFMKTGFNQVKDNNTNNETDLAFASLFMAFTQNALVRAGKYTEHNNRTIVTINDIKNALKVETFNFLNNDNSKTINDWKNYLENINDCEDIDEDYDEDDELEDNNDDIIEDDSIRKCNCDICTEFYNIDNRWIPWEPEEGIPKILKEHIDKHF